MLKSPRLLFPEIWLDLDDFKVKLEKMQAEAAKLAEVAKSGDFNAAKAQVGETWQGLQGVP
jgi:cytochrome c556